MRNRNSTLKGWQLFLILIESYLPTKNLENYIRKYIYDAIAANNSPTTIKVAHFAHYCFRRFQVLCKANRKARLPTDGEIKRSRVSPFQITPFGITLQEIMKDQRLVAKDYPSIPAILTFCANGVLEHDGCSTEGIFRISADIETTFELRLQLESGYYDRNVTKTSDPHAFATLLKMWLGELTDPVIPHSL